MLALKRRWVGYAFHSTYSTYSRGVSILVKRSIPFNLITLKMDYYGRFIIVHCTTANFPLIIVNLYMPPPFTITTLDTISKKLADLPTAPTCYMGDFNALMNPQIDKLNPPFPTGNKLMWTKALGLTDAWRWKNPDQKVYSCHSTTHHSLTRIDLALVTSELLPRITKIQYLPRALSDHSPLSLTLNIIGTPQTNLRRLSPIWLKNNTVLESATVAVTEYWETNEGSASPQIVWDASKAYIRGQLISAIKKARIESKAQVVEAEKDQEEAESAYAANPNPTNYSKLVNSHHTLAREQTLLTRKAQLYTHQHIFETGDRSGRTLAYLAKLQAPSTAIPLIIDSDGTHHSTTQEIAEVFATYFKTLYTTRATYNEAELQQHLSNIPIPALTATQRSTLDSPITKQELQQAINGLAPGKTPRPDGLPADLYKSLTDEITPHLLNTLTTATQNFSLPPSFMEAIIVLILKPQKDPHTCNSYRPISLLNTDAKILAKILASRLAQVMPDLIHPDQTGFMSGKTTDINLRRLFFNLQTIHDNAGSRVVLSLDSAKAFDSVEWTYLWAVLSKFGFGPNFIKWIRMLYLKPTAKVKANGITSNPFPLTRGTRQGCPLSPLLFALAIEPLAILIRQTTELEGWRLGPIEERVSLYADDLLVYLADAGPSLTTLANIITHFGKLSGLQVYWDKSALMRVDPTPLPPLPQDIPLMTVDSFKYLGIQIHPDLNTYMTRNLDLIISSLNNILPMWSKLPLTLWGKVNIFKMVYLPRFLYAFHNSPIHIPKSFFKAVNQTLIHFIWGGKTPRIAWKKLTPPPPKKGDWDYQTYTFTT
uniref:Reverse transcriptase domain-containing protein n=1 Tax=Xenopus tropicalis TaxID=8364 RepID=A0A803JZM0_XENTR